VGADELAARAHVGEQLQAVAHLGRVACDRRHRLGVGQLEEDLLDLLVDGRRQQRQRLVGGLLGREGRIGGVRREHGVHAPDDRAEVAQPRHEALGIVGQLVERQLPTVAGIGHEALHDAEGRVHELALVLVPAAELRDVGEVARAEEAQHLELGVVASLDAPEGLEHERVVVDDRGVRLLGADGANLRFGPRRLHVLTPVELDARMFAVDLGPLAQEAAEQVAGARVGERVVDGDAADLVDHRLVEAVCPHAQQQLVDVVRAAGIARLHQRRGQRRRAVVDRHHVEDVDRRDVARLGAEPAALEQPVGELLLVERGQVNACHRSTPCRPRGPP
jgi:hypothetical protein